MQVDTVTRLDDDQAGAVTALAEAATAADGVGPLSEHVLLHVRNGSAADAGGHSPAHLLVTTRGGSWATPTSTPTSRPRA